MNKPELRKIYVKRRGALSPSQHAEASQFIIEQFFDSIDLTQIGTVNCFISLKHKGEVETQKIFERIWDEHAAIRTLAPRINEHSGQLESVPINRTTLLAENKWKIREPAGEPVDVKLLDLVVVPLLCFDERGHRLGYGKGFYDEFLARCRPECQKIGLCFFPPIEKIDDTHPGDIRLDICITPDGLFRF